MSVKVKSTRPNMVLRKGNEEISTHRDLAEAIEAATNNGAGSYVVEQPDIKIEIEDTSEENDD